MLVGRVARPVAVGGQQFHAHQPVGVRPRLGAAEVRDLTSCRAGAADLDRDVVGGAVAGGQAVVAAWRTAPRSRRRSSHVIGELGVATDVEEVGDAGEHARCARRAGTVSPSISTVTPSVADSGSTNTSVSPVAIVRVSPSAKREHAQAGVAPAGLVGGEQHGIAATRQRTGRDVSPTHADIIPRAAMPGRMATRWSDASASARLKSPTTSTCAARRCCAPRPRRGQRLQACVAVGLGRTALVDGGDERRPPRRSRRACSAR